MSKSRRFRALEKRLGMLGSSFLPKKFSPTGVYTDSQYDLARAYILLAHAEIESYLEDRALEIALKAKSSWKNSNRYSEVTRRLFRFQHRRDKPWKPFDKAPDRIEAVFSSFVGWVGRNHGIKEANVCNLLFPIGIEYEQLNQTWLMQIESFGETRGRVAHSSSIKAQQPPDPRAEFEKVREIRKGLRRLDGKITRLR
jgi:hypothetical protein